MTRITILEQKLVQLQEKRNKAGLVCRKLENNQIDLLSTMFNQVFTTVLEPGDVLETSSDRVRFTRPQSGYSYNKEVLDLYFRSEDWKSETATQIQTSFYSTTDNSEFELRRMILIGKVGQIILDQSQDILQQFNQIKSDTREEISQARKVEWGLDKEITNLKSLIQGIEQENILTQLETDGIEFTETESYKLPTLWINTNRNISRIKNIRITDKTSSGKSADVEVKIIDQIYDMDTKSYSPREVELSFSKVRMRNIESFINCNKNQILK